ncbi:MAG TPA: LysR family transcriptional regulator, partial [Spongiibacteraceae bacterium]|nr:LysR family transcriptional regulator [Spongiibacteraceae bacterium]
QPAVSAALQRLRATFKDDLFIRSRSGMLPTPRAQGLHPDIREALQLVRRAISTQPAFNPAEAERSFTILGDAFFESAMVGSLLNRLTESAPGIRIETASVTQSDPVQALRSLSADLLLDYDRVSSPQLVAERFGEEHLVVLAARSHPRIKRRPSLKAYLH